MVVCDMQGWDEGARCGGVSFPDSGDDVYVDVHMCGGALTFEIKLVDVFQRLVDKVETSESLEEKKSICEIGHIFHK